MQWSAVPLRGQLSIVLNAQLASWPVGQIVGSPGMKVLFSYHCSAQPWLVSISPGACRPVQPGTETRGAEAFADGTPLPSWS